MPTSSVLAGTLVSPSQNQVMQGRFAEEAWCDACGVLQSYAQGN